MSEELRDEMFHAAVEAAIDLTVKAQDHIANQDYAEASYVYSLLGDLSGRIAADLAARATNKIREAVFRPEHIEAANAQDEEEQAPEELPGIGSYL